MYMYMCIFCSTHTHTATGMLKEQSWLGSGACYEASPLTGRAWLCDLRGSDCEQQQQHLPLHHHWQNHTPEEEDRQHSKSCGHIFPPNPSSSLFLYMYSVCTCTMYMYLVSIKVHQCCLPFAISHPTVICSNER